MLAARRDVLITHLRQAAYRDRTAPTCQSERIVMTDLNQLPADLPVPGDDGAADHLVGQQPPGSHPFHLEESDWVAETEVDVRFLAHEEGGTAVELENRGFERLGPDGKRSPKGGGADGHGSSKPSPPAAPGDSRHSSREPAGPAAPQPE